MSLDLDAAQASSVPFTLSDGDVDLLEATSGAAVDDMAHALYGGGVRVPGMSPAELGRSAGSARGKHSGLGTGVQVLPERLCHLGDLPAPSQKDEVEKNSDSASEQAGISHPGALALLFFQAAKRAGAAGLVRLENMIVRASLERAGVVKELASGGSGDGTTMDSEQPERQRRRVEEVRS